MNKDQQRFNRYVAAPDQKGCREWLGSVTQKDGYGQFRQGDKVRPAHIVAYEFAHGPVQDGLVLLHVCDNRRCVNPQHLRPGTQAANVDDMVQKDRAVIQGTTLSREEVEQARKRVAAGELQQDVAASFGVSDSSMSRYLLNQRFAHRGRDGKGGTGRPA